MFKAEFGGVRMNKELEEQIHNFAVMMYKAGYEDGYTDGKIDILDEIKEKYIEFGDFLVDRISQKFSASVKHLCPKCSEELKRWMEFNDSENKIGNAVIELCNEESKSNEFFNSDSPIIKDFMKKAEE